jgi:DUF4097 and DUF4098 domain-containing protein YvlB
VRLRTGFDLDKNVFQGQTRASFQTWIDYMKNSIIKVVCMSVIMTSLPVLAADENTGKTISKSFTVEPGGELTVHADQGDIEVLASDKNTVEVVVEREVRGASESKAASVLKGHKLTFSQDGNKIRVDSVTPNTLHSLFSFSHANLSIHFRITVPKRFNTSLNTAGGNIKVTDLNGAVDAHSSGGNLAFAGIQGIVDGHTSGGSIKATDCTDKLTVQSSGGNIVIKNFTGPSALGETSGGNIDVEGCTGGLKVETSGGNIAIRAFSGGTAYADTSGGSVSIELDKQPTGDCFLHSSGGNITARVNDRMALNLIASTDGGSVSSAVPVTVEGKQKEGSLIGKINGGGPKLTLKTSGGDISVAWN